jgi:uncharacterized protein (TIGR03435 family)
MIMRRLTLALIVAAASVPVAVAQQPPAFAAASIKVNPTGLHPSGLPGGTTDVRPGGRFSALNVPALELITMAWNIESYRVTGGPDWLRSTRFNVEASAGADVPREQVNLMLRALLAERLQLRARLVPREMPTYTLLVIRADGRLGPGLRPASTAACVTRAPGRVPPGELPTCGQLRSGPDRLSGRSVPLEEFRGRLSGISRRVVVDKSGLAGVYDIDLEWAPGESALAAVAALTPGTPPAPVDPDRAPLETAISEQLGLRLQSTRGMVDVLSIEGAELPAQ